MASRKPQLRVGLIGTGFMGKTHVFGFAAAQRVFDLPYELVLAHGRRPHRRAGRSRRRARSASTERSGDWRTLVEDPEIDLDRHHRPERTAQGDGARRHRCRTSTSIARSHWRRLRPTHARWPRRRKPPASRPRSASTISATRCSTLAREMIAAGELGEIRSYRGIHAEDYMADAASPFSFRNDPVGGGAWRIMGSHALATPSDCSAEGGAVAAHGTGGARDRLRANSCYNRATRHREQCRR